MSERSMYLTPQDVAQLAGVSSWTVRQWERDGKLPAERTAGAGIRLFRRADVDRLLADRRAKREGR
jgi:excisionase family DNA binding protein